LGESIRFHAAVVALGHFRRQQLAPRRVDALANDDEGRIEADHHFLGGRADDGIGHIGNPFTK
jgi:hypothetical protein